MSYLGPLRLHFAGQFQANVSTVNNDPTHFDNAAFVPSYQLMQTQGHPNGWFNPQGDAAFRLLGCNVTSAWTPTGQVEAADPVVGCLIADSDRNVPAKLVDLDPQQQLVSTIWGLRVRITDASGNNFLSANFEPAAFTDIWDRARGTGVAGGDIGACATYQSILTELEWGDLAASPFLTELQAAARESGRLSIKFMTDSLNADFTSPHFMCGRIVGTIGPAAPGEPAHVLWGRHMMAEAASPTTGNFFEPAGQINFCAGVVDDATSTLYLDLGNALHTDAGTGAVQSIGDLTLRVDDQSTTSDEGPASLTALGILSSRGPHGYAGDPSWYERTAGIVAFPLTAAQMSMVADSRLALTGPAGSSARVFIAERPAGTFVRADKFVFRMSPGDSQDIAVYASRWGRPLSGAEVRFTLDASQLQQVPHLPVATPDVLSFQACATTGTDGVARLQVTSADPRSPRWFRGGTDYGIDGQVYGVRPEFADPDLAAGPVNQWDFISFLVWSHFDVPNPVTWRDVQPIFQQYANLYPVMLRFLNMAKHEQIVANADLLRLAFSLPLGDPNAMPVTRDLSPAKRQAILAWLADPLPAEQPVAEGAASVMESEPAEPGREDGPPSPGAPTTGGKAAAAARRLIHANNPERTES